MILPHPPHRPATSTIYYHCTFNLIRCQTRCWTMHGGLPRHLTRLTNVTHAASVPDVPIHAPSPAKQDANLLLVQLGQG